MVKLSERRRDVNGRDRLEKKIKDGMFMDYIVPKHWAGSPRTIGMLSRRCIIFQMFLGKKGGSEFLIHPANAAACF